MRWQDIRHRDEHVFVIDSDARQPIRTYIERPRQVLDSKIKVLQSEAPTGELRHSRLLHPAQVFMVRLDRNGVPLKETGELLKRPHHCARFLLERAVITFRQRVLTAGVRDGQLLALVVELKQHSTCSELTGIAANKDLFREISVCQQLGIKRGCLQVVECGLALVSPYEWLGFFLPIVVSVRSMLSKK